MNRIQQLTALEAEQALKDGARKEQRQTVTESRTPCQIGQILPAQSVEGNWVPVAFADRVGSGMTTMQHAGQPWILFRDSSGNAACIEDCCAHRACPLSLVLSDPLLNLWILLRKAAHSL